VLGVRPFLLFRSTHLLAVAPSTHHHPLSSKNTHSQQQEQPTGRAFAPEAVTALAASPCGRLLAAGGGSGAAWMWEAGSGRLLRAWAPHYRAVTALAWGGGSGLLLTGGGDGGVAAWDVADLADAEAGMDGRAPTPLAAWSHHTLPVSAVWAGGGAGGGGGAGALAASASADHTLSFYAPAGGALLRTLRLPAALTALVVEPGEHAAYAGGEDGVVYEVDLVGGAGGGGSGGGSGGSASGATSRSPAVTPLRGHTAPITALAAPAAAAILLSGSADGSVRVWDARTRVPLRCLATPGKAPVAALLVLPPLLGPLVGGGRRGGGSKAAGPAAATTLPPLARPGARHPRPWEGGLAALGGAAPFAGRVAASGALGGVGGAAAAPGGSVADWDCAGGGGGGDASTSAASAAAADWSADEAVRELEAQLEAARSEAARWKALHGELMAEAARALGGSGGGG
jgi:pre-rRNA-processing protein IPI3